MADNPNKEFTFRFTYAQAEYIISKMGDLPYKDTHEIITNMKKDYEAQLNLVSEPPPMSGDESESAQQEAADDGTPSDDENACRPAPAPEESDG